jgi:mono/diheme cytochrome c family protein
MGRFILGVIVGLILLPIGIYFYFSTGHVPTAVSAEPMPFEKRLARMGLQSAIERQAPKYAPFQPAEADYTAAAWLFRENCSSCHGLPNQPKPNIAKGMYPAPPQLWKGKGVTDDPVGESYWKIANGIRLTGMPGYKTVLDDHQIWQLSWLLANGDKLPASASEVLNRPAVVDRQPISQGSPSGN